MNVEGDSTIHREYDPERDGDYSHRMWREVGWLENAWLMERAFQTGIQLAVASGE